MNLLYLSVVLGLFVSGSAHVLLRLPPVQVRRPFCDSPEAEEAALVALDYINNQHAHGYKYALNRIEKIKIYHESTGDEMYVLEIDLLETECHVMDPTPVANCTVRPKAQTAVEGDCDVLLSKPGGVLKVIAFKCKTDESDEDMCLNCPTLLPLNDTRGFDFVHASLVTLNNRTDNMTFALLEVGRMSSKLEPGQLFYIAEYVVVEANCTDNACVPLNDAMAVHGICTAQGHIADHTVDCKMFSKQPPVQDTNSTTTAAPALPPLVHVHADNLPAKHGLRHHKLKAAHNLNSTRYLSAESTESAEVVPVAPAVVDAIAPAVDTPVIVDSAPVSDTSSGSDASASAEVPVVVVKREVHATPASPLPVAVDQSLIQVCPGRVRFF